MIPWRIARKVWMSKTKMKPSRDLQHLLKIKVCKIKKFHMRMEEWNHSENNRITLETANESLLSNE